MKSSLPTNNDVKKILLKRQRRKNIIPAHATATSILNAEILDCYKAIEKTTSHPLREAVDKQLRDLLDRKQQAEDNIVENFRQQLEDYILNPPKKLRLKIGIQNDRRIITWNKRRSTLLLFDELCALKLRQSFHVNYYGRDRLIRILLDGIVGTEDAKTSSRRSILRLDIKNFYESINRVKLVKKLSSHSGVPGYITNHIERISDSMKRLDTRFNECGLPNGISSSSVLSEIYLESLDRAVKNHPAVSIYLRYNDDILAIIEPGWESDVSNLVIKQLEELGLKVSDKNEKYTLIKHPDDSESGFEYLGYSFVFDSSKNHLSSIDISTKKTARLKRAVDNICDLIDEMPCVVNSPRMNHAMKCVEYLMRPHFSDPGTGATRIVSGLAYSAKFVRHSPQQQKNLKEFIEYAKQQIMGKVRTKLNINGSTKACTCCGLEVPEKYDLMSKMTIYASFENVMCSPAVPHVIEDERKRIFNVLWK
ncbi:reverse transcriptase domain-containing protein [Brevibacterium linens]|uniref:reverse transcriptase domain-containing protein n=1 Tax=Brevibacterium linens TaxID=1703 RepID=UPI003BF5124E